MDSGLDESLALFVADCGTQLDALESHLLALEREPAARELLDAIFRAAHTIKGNATVVQLGEIEWFAHVTESVLERLRKGELLASGELISVLLACCDHLRFLIASSTLGMETTPAFAEQDRARLIGMLVPWLGDEVEVAAAVPIPKFSERSADECWRIELRLAPEALRQGLDPFNFLRHLETLGRVHDLQVDDQFIPPPDSFDPECCYLRFSVVLDTGADKQAIEDVFSFMREACELQVEPPQCQLEDWVELIESLPEYELQTGEMLVRVGAITPEELASGLHRQRAGEHEPIGQILVNEGFVAPQVVEAAVRRQGEIRCELLRDAGQLRVSVERLDQLMNSLEGMQLSLNQLARRGTRVSAVEMVALQHSLEKARQLASGLRSARFAEQFRRLHRLVRDTALDLGKRADLLVSGGEVEMDRAVADTLADALMHLLRNAIDHGLETPEQRKALGKPASGSLSLSVRQVEDQLHVRVSDDGAGVDFARVRAKAQALGWLSAEAELEHADLLEFLFRPGFSTAENLSHYSGRGVGLDAVRVALQALEGEISLRSQAGQGCSFDIRLPVRCTGSSMALRQVAAA